MLRSRKESSVASGDFAGAAPTTFAVDLQERNKLLPPSDVQHQEVRVYIEGVQVPFTTLSISQNYMAKPTASISIPPATGLTEIARNYFPKVHIFFRDVQHERYLLEQNLEYEDKDVMKLLFSGVIHRSSYFKSSNAGGAAASINFQCVHRDYPVDEILIKYGGRGSEVFRGLQSTQDVAGQVNLLSSQQGALKALEGLKSFGSTSKLDVQTFIDGYYTGKYTEKDINKVDPAIMSYVLQGLGKFDDLKGIPSVLLILWQIIVMDSYRFKEEFTHAMRRLYIPLIDDGLTYFQRMKGHKIIEEELDNDKYKLDNTTIKLDDTSGNDDVEDVKSVIVPPQFRSYLGKALSTDLSIKVVQNLVMGATETMSLQQVFLQIINMIRYDKIYLASPVQSVNRDREAIDKVVKPLMPFYYSPTCNVLLPNMYHSISVSDMYYDTPTRVKTVNSSSILAAAESNGGLEYRAPHYVRKAVAEASYRSRGDGKVARPGSNTVNLSSSLVHRGEVAGDHELGQGIRSKHLPTPGWLSHLFKSQEKQEISGLGTDDSLDDEEQSSLQNLIDGWNEKYPDQESFNPWEERDTNGLYGYQRNIMTSIEYDYALSSVETRAGQLNGIFNPYIIPGYPCDILDPSPDRPSYHAFVLGVTHSVAGGGSIGTSITFSSALTYDEMQSYDMPPTVPWLRSQLGLDKKSNLLEQSEETKAIASDYYKDVLGVGFADPSYLYNFNTGEANRVSLNTYYGDFAERENGVSKIAQDPGTSLFDTVEGSMMMVRREIESMADIERGKANVEFIDVEERDADPSTFQVVKKDNLTPEEQKDVEIALQKATDVGKSIFLKYPENVVSDEPESTSPVPSTSSEEEESAFVQTFGDITDDFQ